MSERGPIGIVGLGDSRCVLEDPRSIPEMVLCAVEEALDDAQLKYEDIDAVVTASVDLFDGLTASNIAVTEVVGAVMRPETRIAADGLAAVVHAACQIWAGAYQTVLVAAHGKASMSSHDELTKWAMDPVVLQPLGTNFLICSALQAEMIRAADSRAEQRWAAVASVLRTRAGENGIAGLCSAEDILGTDTIASPLRHGMRAPLGDGAYAVVLRKEAGDIRLTGVGHDLSAHGLWDATSTRWEGLERAHQRALATSGAITQSGAPGPSTIDLYEPSCHFAHEEELFRQACGLDESANVSPRGGLFGGLAPATGGLARLIAAARSMRDQANIKRSLAHGTWGPAGQGQVVTILERAA